MRFCSLGSGSGGNATLIEASQGITQTRVLVDCGFSLRELTLRLERAGMAPDELDAVFITHEHGDHAGCVLPLARKHGVPVYTSRGTWRAISAHNPELDAARVHFVSDDEVVDLGDLELRPFAVPHDAQEPLQLRVSDGLRRLALITDIGSLAPRVLAALQGQHGLLLECNHDEALLRGSNYPESLKRRILGTHGHLANPTSAELLSAVLHPGLNVVVAAHLSERNNRPELAREALSAVLGCAPADVPVADQALGVDWLEV
jgi:phosphoribosyl 1,2-cyclic phosphodiesterase